MVIGVVAAPLKKAASTMILIAPPPALRDEAGERGGAILEQQAKPRSCHGEIRARERRDHVTPRAHAVRRSGR
jgi:hypothetical protein